MQTSFKVLAAGVLASSAYSLKVEDKTPAIFDHYDYCDYHCVEDKVDETFAVMKEKISDTYDQCVVHADDIRGDILSAVAALREELTSSAQYSVSESVKTLVEEYTASVEMLTDTLGVVQDAIHEEKNTVWWKVKELVNATIYKIKHGYHGHDAIKKIVEEFEGKLQAKSEAFDAFVTEQREILEAAISAKKTAFAHVVAAEADAFNTAAAEAAYSFQHLKAQKLAALEALIDEKLRLADESIKALKWYFVDKFLATLYSIHEHVDYYERRQLVWWAVEKKGKFFNAVWNLRKELGYELAATRATLVGELQDEQTAFSNAMDASRNFLAEQSGIVSTDLWNDADNLREGLDDFGDQVDAWLDGKLMDVGEDFKHFLHGYSYNFYTPRGYTHYRPHYGYHDYGYSKVHAIKEAIAHLGESIIADFQAKKAMYLAEGQMSVDNRIEQLADANQAFIDEVTVATEILVETVVIIREDNETRLATAQEEAQEALAQVREEIEYELTALKVELVDKIKWLLKKLWGYHGYDGAYAIKAQIQDKMWEFKKAAEAARSKYAHAQAAALEKFSGEANDFEANYTAFLDDKQTAWQDAFDKYSEKAAEVRARFVEGFEKAIANSKVNAQEKIDEKRAKLDDAFYKIQWKIKQIHDYHLQHELTEALIHAKKELNAKSQAIAEAIFEIFEQEVRDWVAALAAMAAKARAANADNQAACVAAVEEQGALFWEFTGLARNSFDDFLANELDGFSVNIKAIEWKFQELVKKAQYSPVVSYGHYNYRGYNW